MQRMTPVHPIPLDSPPSKRSELFAVLTRIDGWGPGAWREIYRTWHLRQAVLSVDDLEAGISRDDDDRVAAFVLVFPQHKLGLVDDPHGPHAAAMCDWVLRRAWDEIVNDGKITVTTHSPGQEIRASNACVLTAPSVGSEPTLVLRLLVRLPMAGMCCNGKALKKFITRLERFAASLSTTVKRPTLHAHIFTALRQHALRQALKNYQLIAFIGDGARLARTNADRPHPHTRAWKTPRADRISIDLGKPFGRVHGLGIRRGITAIAGAPYHGKSTVLSALAAGRDNHIADDGRELVVADDSALIIRAEDGRLIKNTDMSQFFRNLPGGQSEQFTTERASGATSMAASMLQCLAAGGTTLLIDEDSAASNFLSIDPIMRRVLGRALDGFTTVLEALPAMKNAGISTVLVAGAQHHSLHVADDIIVMEHFQPRRATKTVKTILPATTKKLSTQKWIMPQRQVNDHPDCLFGPRHFLRVDVTEPERPVVNDMVIDLRRAGWELDKASVRGALAAAAWCCRLADNEAVTLTELKQRYEQFITTGGIRALDPFDTVLMTVPPWQLVVTVLERLSMPRMRSGE
jgi:Predicted ATPase of the ABC class